MKRRYAIFRMIICLLLLHILVMVVSFNIIGIYEYSSRKLLNDWKIEKYSFERDMKNIKNYNIEIENIMFRNRDNYRAMLNTVAYGRNVLVFGNSGCALKQFGPSISRIMKLEDSLMCIKARCLK